MGAPTSEVGYTSATTGRETMESIRIRGGTGKKKLLIDVLEVLGIPGLGLLSETRITFEVIP
jgi:hypothetical protein